MSILSICSIACITLFDLAAFLSCSISPKIVGTICHDSVFVFKPAASLPVSALGELLLKLIYFFLRLAVHNERYGFREGKLRATV